MPSLLHDLSFSLTSERDLSLKLASARHHHNFTAFLSLFRPSPSRIDLSHLKSEQTMAKLFTY